MEWLVWIVVIIAAVLWFAGREDSSSDPSSTLPQDHSNPPPRPAPPRPTAGDLRRERDDEAFADGAVFGWFAYREWFADGDGDLDGLAGESQYDEDFEDEMHDDAWDEFDDGFGF